MKNEIIFEKYTLSEITPVMDKLLKDNNIKTTKNILDLLSSIISICNGIIFYECPTWNHANEEHVFSEFFGIDKNNEGNDLYSLRYLLPLYKTTRDGERIIDLIPFAGDGGDNYYCIHEQSGEIYYWFHEENDGNIGNIGTKIADSFIKLIEQIIEQNGGNVEYLSEIYEELKKKGFE